LRKRTWRRNQGGAEEELKFPLLNLVPSTNASRSVGDSCLLKGRGLGVRAEITKKKKRG